MCPFNQLSKVLRDLLQHLCNDVQEKLFPVLGNNYPIVLGTESYLERLSLVKLKKL